MLYAIQNLPAVGFAKEARGIHHSGGRIEAAGQGAGVSPPPLMLPAGFRASSRIASTEGVLVSPRAVSSSASPARLLA
jgi:hypothetical protein